MSTVSPRQLAAQAAAVTLHSGRVAKLEGQQKAHDDAKALVAEAHKAHLEAVELFELAVALKDHKEVVVTDAARLQSVRELAEAHKALNANRPVADDLRAARVTLARAKKELERLEQTAREEAKPLAHSPFQGLWAAVKLSPPAATQPSAK